MQRIYFLGGQDLWKSGLSEGFRELGHEVIVSRPKTAVIVEKIISTFNPDIIFTFGCTRYYSQEVLEYLGTEIKDTKILYTHWDTEGITYGENYEIPFIKTSNPDFVFTVCPDMLDVLKQSNIQSAILPYGYNPNIHHKADNDDRYVNLITLLGRSYSNVLCRMPNHCRTQSFMTLVKPLLDNGIRIDFWGDKWHVIRSCLHCNLPESWVHGFCEYLKTFEIYSNSAINLVPQNHKNHLTKRTFEILGSQGFVLTYDTPEVRRLFKPKHDLIVSSCPEETLELVNFYLKHPEKREKIKRNGKKAVKKHTYMHRAKYIMDTLRKENIL